MGNCMLLFREFGSLTIFFCFVGTHKFLNNVVVYYSPNSYPAGRPFSDTFTVLECASCYAYRGIYVFFTLCFSNKVTQTRTGGWVARSGNLPRLLATS